MIEDEAKLKFYGLLANDPNLDPRPLVQDFDVSIHKLRRWIKDYNASIEEGKIENLVDLEQVVSDRIIDTIADDTATAFINTLPKLDLDTEKKDDKFVKALPEDERVPELVIDEKTNDIITQEELDKRELERKQQQDLADSLSGDLKLGVNGLRDLKTATYDVALGIVDVIQSRVQILKDRNDVIIGTNGDIAIKAIPTYTRDVVDLSNAICNIQNAFFNKPVTNVQVNNETSVGFLADFRSNLKN